MTFDQAAILTILALAIVAFALDRWRVEAIALCALAAAFLLQLVPARDVFSGFANPAVITVVEILIISQLIARSRIVTVIGRRLTDQLASEGARIAVLCALGAGLSVFMNNIGALALLMPLVLSASESGHLTRRRVLIPLSFATLLGGLCSVIGTPANLIVARARAAATGESFGFFDFAYAGLPIALLGLAFLGFVGWRLLRPDRGRGDGPKPRPPGRFVTEATVPDGSPLAGLPLAALEWEIGGTVHGILRNGRRVFAQKSGTTTQAGDLLVLEAPLDHIEALLASELLLPAVELPAGAARIQAVVMPQSTIVGSAPGAVAAFESHGVEVLAVAPQRHRVEGRLEDIGLAIGDVLVLCGEEDAVAAALAETDCLLLTPRTAPDEARPARAAILWFGLGIALAATGLVPPEIAFGLVVLALVVTRSVNLRTALADVNWGIVVMLGAMIPLGAALQSTGAAALIARTALSAGGNDLLLLTAGTLLVAVVVTPFVANVSTAVILSPIAASIAAGAGLPVEPFLMAIAIGASTEFLTPFGHHNNAIVMGPGGYRFLDYPRVGAPLTLLVLLVAPPLLVAVWG